MWKYNGDNISMTEGDFGITLQITFSDVAIDSSDSFKLTIKKVNASEATVEKTYTDISDNNLNIVLSKSDSEALEVGQYLYRIDWYNAENFMGKKILSGAFTVEAE